MDYRPYILAGTFLLSIVAAIVFLVTLSRARREDQMAPPRIAQHDPATLPARDHEVDTDLAGLDVALSADAPSAALLTPLRTGQWHPPEDPAPAEQLNAASLDERISEFVPAPSVPEPQFSVERYSAWEVDEELLTTDAAPVSALDPLKLPEVWPAAHDDEFAAEIAALLPEPVEPAPSEPLEPIQPPAPVELTPLEPLEPTPPMPLEPTTPPEPVPAEPEAHEPSEPVEEPVAPTVEAPQADSGGEEFWQGALLEQLGERPSVFVPEAVEPTATPRPIAPVPVASGEPRPQVRVSLHEAPVPVEPAPVVEPAPATPRPRVRVASLQGVVGQSAEPLPEYPAVRPPRQGTDVPDLVMAAPVEMWFGESRIGVKAGSATYDRFRKYADSLLADLKEARTETR